MDCIVLAGVFIKHCETREEREYLDLWSAYGTISLEHLQTMGLSVLKLLCKTDFDLVK